MWSHTASTYCVLWPRTPFHRFLLWPRTPFQRSSYIFHATQNYLGDSHGRLRFSQCFCSPHGTIPRSLIFSARHAASILSLFLRFTHHKSTILLSKQLFSYSPGRLIFSQCDSALGPQPWVTVPPPGERLRQMLCNAEDK